MMRLLADENLSPSLVSDLRGGGHDVLFVQETHRGMRDESVLALAQAEDRILITSDKDFGELAFRARLPARAGVILLRIDGDSPETEDRLAFAAIQSRDDWAGRFSVITEQTVRVRAL